MANTRRDDLINQLDAKYRRIDLTGQLSIEITLDALSRDIADDVDTVRAALISKKKWQGTFRLVPVISASDAADIEKMDGDDADLLEDEDILYECPPAKVDDDTALHLIFTPSDVILSKGDSR